MERVVFGRDIWGFLLRRLACEESPISVETGKWLCVFDAEIVYKALYMKVNDARCTVLKHVAFETRSLSAVSTVLFNLSYR